MHIEAFSMHSISSLSFVSSLEVMNLFLLYNVKEIISNASFNIDIEGKKRNEKAAGLSFVMIAVSVVLMLLYLQKKKKRRQMCEQSFEFFDSLLNDESQIDDSKY